MHSVQIASKLPSLLCLWANLAPGEASFGLSRSAVMKRNTGSHRGAKGEAAYRSLTLSPSMREYDLKLLTRGDRLSFGRTHSYFLRKRIQPRKGPTRIMAKDSIPAVLPINPVSVECPHCTARPGHDCITDSGAFSVIHLARISAVARKV